MTESGLEGGGSGHLEDEAGGSGEDNLAVTSIIVAASVVAVCTSILVLVVIYQKCVDRVKAANTIEVQHQRTVTVTDGSRVKDKILLL